MGYYIKKILNGTQLRCLKKDEVDEVMKEIHAGVCGSHMNGIILAKKIVRQGYYWMSMEKDCIQTVRQCHQCQIYGNLNHLPPTMLNSLSSPWPFAAWGIDIIGEIRPNASNGHKYIVVVIDYFSRWIEVESFATLKAKQMAKFIEKSLICRYGVAHHVVTDNGVQFQAETTELLQRYGIEHHKSSPYRPQANGAVEAANKNVK